MPAAEGGAVVVLGRLVEDARLGAHRVDGPAGCLEDGRGEPFGRGGCAAAEDRPEPVQGLVRGRAPAGAGDLSPEQGQAGAAVAGQFDAHHAPVAAARPLVLDQAEDAPQQPVGRVRADKHRGQADGRGKEDLAAFALGVRVVGDVAVVDAAVLHPGAGQGTDQGLQVDGLGKGFPQVRKERIEPSLETGKAVVRHIAHPAGQVDGHAVVEHAHLEQVALEPLLVADPAVQGRAPVHPGQGHQVVEQADVGQVVAAQAEHPAEQAVQPGRAERGQAVAATAVGRLLLPAPPEHAQVAGLQFMRQVAEHLFRVELVEGDPKGRGGAGGDEQRQEMLDDLDHQVALVLLGAVVAGLADPAGEQPAAQGDVGAVVGQRGGRGVGQDHQVVDDDARFAQPGDGVQLAARQGLVTERHVRLLLLAPVPAGQAGVAEQLAVELVGDQVVESFLPGRRVGRQVEVAGLAVVGEGKGLVGELDEQLQQEELAARFGGSGPTGQGGGPPAGEHEGGDLGRAVVADEMAHHPFAGVAQGGERARIPAEGLGQGQLEQVTDRQPQPDLAVVAQVQLAGVGAQRAVCFGFVGAQVRGQGGGRVGGEQAAGKTHPGVFPDAVGAVVEEFVQVGEGGRRQVAPAGAEHEVLVVARAADGQGQVHPVPAPLDGHLELVLHADGYVFADKGQGVCGMRGRGRAGQHGAGMEHG